MSWFWCVNVIRFRYTCKPDLRSEGCKLENLQIILSTTSVARVCDYPHRLRERDTLVRLQVHLRMRRAVKGSKCPRWQPPSISAGSNLWTWRMAGAKRTESPSEIDPDVKTEARKSFEHIWLNAAVPVRTMGSFESDAGQRYRSPVSSSMCEHCLITKLQHPPARATFTENNDIELW